MKIINNNKKCIVDTFKTYSNNLQFLTSSYELFITENKSTDFKNYKQQMY